MIQFPLIDAQLSAGELREGMIVRIKVLEPSGNGAWKAKVMGKTVTIKPGIELRPGDVLKARFSRSGGQNVLRIMPEHSDPPVVPPNISSKDQITRLLVQLFQNSRSQPRPDALTKIRALFQRRKSKLSQGILATMLAKGLDLDEQMVDSIEGILSGHGGNGSRHNKSRRRPRRDNTPESPPADSIVDQLTCQLELQQEDGHQLHLYNHVIGNPQNWIVLPYRVYQGSQSVEGSIRISISKTMKINRVVVEISGEEGATDFSFNWPLKEKGDLILRTEDNSLQAKMMRKKILTKEKLRNLNLIIDDNSNKTDVDWFTQETLPLLPEVDELV